MTFKQLTVAIMCSAALSAWSDKAYLPMRITPVPQTTNSVPHVQIGIQAKPELTAALLQRVNEFPGVDIRDTIISLPGAKGFWLDEDIVLAREDAIVGGREFAHIHPDGSLHASLAPDLAHQAVKKGWAISHPWSGKRSGWEGFVMIYTPTNKEELDVVLRLVIASYNFVTGQSLTNTSNR